MSNTVTEKCALCRAAVSSLANTKCELRNTALLEIARLLYERRADILKANDTDMSAAAANGVKQTMLDRLKLTEARISAICDSVRDVVSLPDPLGKGEVFTRPNGLIIEKVRVPLGVIGIIYEARPNVTADAAVLCIKSGNGVILRGGKEAVHSGKAITDVIREALANCGINPDTVQFVDDVSRDSAYNMMRARGSIDLLIPRGGKGLIRSVTENATVPVIETGAGNCHIYAEKSCDIGSAVAVIKNAKESRPSVCNAAEHLLVDTELVPVLLPALAAAMPGTEFRADSVCAPFIPSAKPVTEEDDDTEYNDMILSVRAVSGIGEAIAHINAHSTGHSEAILTNDLGKSAEFTAGVDSAAVYVNASTRFTDGGEFGYGAEIGISTQKLHARGPMGLPELTTVKYIIRGSGQIR